MAFDLVIKNGMLVDGSGGEPRRADIGIEGDRITAVGKVEGSRKREVEADGHVVSPGFIDAHTHMDAQVFWDPLGTSSSWNGVTTCVMGNCGFTLAPVRRGEESLTTKNLERAEDIPAVALREGVNFTWEHFSEYLDAVERLPKGINFSAYIGHSALRTYAMGERAFEEGANDADLQVMTAELRDALAAGARGFSTTRSPDHETADDRPVASRLASWDEYAALVTEVGQFPGRVCELSLEPGARDRGGPDQAEYFDRMKALARKPGVALSFSAIPVPWGPDLLTLIEESNAEGGQMIGQCTSRGLNLILSFKTKLPFDRLPGWKKIRELPLEQQRPLLEDPHIREALVAEAYSGDYGRSIGGEPKKPEYDHIRLLDRPTPPNPTVAEVAAARGVDPVELMIDLALETDFDQFFLQPFLPFTQDQLESIMKHPETVMTFSDAGAHVSQLCDASIQTHLLAYWVRDRQAFTLEKAVQMITHRPASLWGFNDRGLVREGFAADLNIFDPDTIGPEMPTLEQDLPGNERRFCQRASGILATVVGGEILFEKGQHTGATPGRLVRAGN